MSRSKISLSLLVLFILLINVTSQLTYSEITNEAISLYKTQSAGINVDGNPSEWGAFECPTFPVGDLYGQYYYSTIDSIPQWIWCDAVRDERTDFAEPDPRVDLVQFRVTGDESYLYMLLMFKDMSGWYIGDNGGTFIVIAIARNGTGIVDKLGFGIGWGQEAETFTNPSAKWHYQIVINLADYNYSGSMRRNLQDTLYNDWRRIFLFITIIDSSWILLTSNEASIGIDLDNNAIELRIPWELVGGEPANGVFYLRFTLITARGWSNPEGAGVWDIGEENTSDALDVMTTMGPNTWNEVGDLIVDYYADVYFTTSPPHYPIPEPSLITAIATGLTSIGIVGFALYKYRYRSNKVI